MRFLTLALVVVLVFAAREYTFNHGSIPPPITTGPVSAPPPPPGTGNPVPDSLKQPTMLYFRKLFVLPDTVLWHFDFSKPYPLGGTTLCGRVNFQNSMRVYGGDKLFYTIFQDGKLVDGGVVGNVVDDPVGTTAASRRRFCEDA
jgi:hypothetical protein